MKISHNWLLNYLDTNLSPEKISELLTSTGLEVESVTTTGISKDDLKDVVIGEVLEVEKHPDADRLKITKVNVGADEPLQIVCGASNVAIGQTVVVAQVGANLKTVSGENIKIKKSKIRGIESAGMICAEDEIGLSENHDGIMVLTHGKPGTPAAEILTTPTDSIYEIGLTPNRSDAMSHIGVARDIKAWLNVHKRKNLQIKFPIVTERNHETKNQLKISLQNTQKCIRYSGAVITGIEIKESPEWLKNRLSAIGLKPINNIVDITNFVLHETGNPLHAFDLSHIGNEIKIREAAEGEELVTLDNVNRKLHPEDLMICNANKPLCIAGVMGGLHSGVSSQTKNIFLEAACFHSTTVRRTTKRHVLNSDSSFRFERGVDPNNVLYARNRAIDLILEFAGGKVSELHDNYPEKVANYQIDFQPDYCRKLAGINISNEEMSHILAELAYGVEMQPDTWKVSVPTFRYDVTRPADLVEEVLRIYGFNQVPIPEKLNASLSYQSKPDNDKIQNLIADLLTSSGFYEIMNNSLTAFNEKTSQGIEAVKLLNPLSNELDTLRYNLFEGGLRTIEFNQNRQHPDLKIYEFGKIYSKREDSFVENKRLALFITGNIAAENWNNGDTKSSFYNLKAAVNKIFTRLGLEQSIKETALKNAFFEDGLSVQIQNKTVAQIGWIKYNIVKSFGVKQQVFYADVDWDLLVSLSATAKTEFKALPKTQFVRRDFSLLLDQSVKFESIESIAKNISKPLLQSVGLFDVYEGKNLPEGKKSYAVSFYFQDNEKTLQDEQIDATMTAIREKLQSELKAELR